MSETSKHRSRKAGVLFLLGLVVAAAVVVALIYVVSHREAPIARVDSADESSVVPREDGILADSATKDERTTEIADARKEAPLPVEDDVVRETRKFAAARLEAKLPSLDAPMSDAEKRDLKRKGILTNASKSLAALRRDPNVLLLRNAIIDTSLIRKGGESVSIPEAFRASEDTTKYIVQFGETLSDATRSELEQAGAKIEHYVPNRAYAVTADEEALTQIQNLPDVQYVEPYHPYFKMSGDVQGYLLGGVEQSNKARVEQGRFNVLLFSGEGNGSELEKLGAEVGRVRKVDENIVIAEVACSPNLLGDLLRSDGVKWVEPNVPAKVMNDLAFETTKAKATVFNHAGLNGKGVRVAVADTGVDYTHRGFSIDPTQPTSTNLNSRIVYYSYRSSVTSDGDPGDAGGHGSHVAGSILGNGGWSTNVLKAPGSGTAPYATNQFAGMAPGASLIMLEDFNSFTDEEIASIGYGQGARLSSHSWGASVYEYGTACQAWDALVRDADDAIPGNQKLATFFSAGNDGNGSPSSPDGTAGTIGQPGLAKNVVTIGAVEALRLCNNLDEAPYYSYLHTDTDWQIAGFSSRGPASDGRFKPDVVAPGDYVLSIQSKDVDFDTARWPTDLDRDYHYGNLDTGPKYAVMSGTSMAAPVAAGTAALLMQHYTNTYGSVPSPALIKAMLANGAREVHSYIYEYGDEVESDGWGMINLARTVDGPRTFASAGITYYDENDTEPLSTGDTFDETITINSYDEGGLKITIAWSDYPGTPGAGKALVNDLNLVVTAPDGTVYQGNMMGRYVWGTASADFDSYNSLYTDPVNNVETVIIRHLMPGDYTVEVRGYEVPQPSQSFAMVISRGISSAGEMSAISPCLALDANGRPVLAYTCSSTGIAGDLGLIGVRHWEGATGNISDYGHWVHMREKWFSYGREMGDEIINGQVLDSQVYDPSVAVNKNNGNVYVAWVNQSHKEEDPNSIYLRYFDGTEWDDLGDSYKGFGICDDDITADASSPHVGIAWDGNPLVAYIQADGGNLEVVVKKWNGADWVALGGGYVHPGTDAWSLDMVMDANGRPVLAFHDYVGTPIDNPVVIRCYRWTGAAWTKVGSDFGNYPYSYTPSVAVNGDNVYIAWVEWPPSVDNPSHTVRVAVNTGGSSWSGLGGSKNYPGISGETNAIPYSPQIGVASTNVFVSWQSGESLTNSILLKKWTGAAWEGIDGSGNPPGIMRHPVEKELRDMVVDEYGMPVVAVEFVNTVNDKLESWVFGLAGNTEPPLFAGLRTATGTSSNTVDLTWFPASSSGTDIWYHVYQSTTSWDPTEDPVPDPSDVFSNRIATVLNSTNYTVSPLAADRLWYFGVRAENEAGIVDGNTVLRLAGPYTLLGDADMDWLVTSNELELGTEPLIKDTDGDGMWDGWEWWYSTNNPAYTNVAVHTNYAGMDPLTAGGVGQGAYDDMDGDGLFNIEEFAWWKTNRWRGWSVTLVDDTNPTNWWLDPVNPDTDGDGMGDGWEYMNDGFDPGDASDAFGDADGDGVINSNEYQWGTNPNHGDTDSDGLSDSNEVYNTFTDPRLADTDKDGLDDGFEASVGGDPLDADSNDDGVSDGDEYQIGYNDVGASRTNVVYLLRENFEGGSNPWTGGTDTWTNWSSYSPGVDLWHRTMADPDPPATNTPPPPTPRYMHQHTTNLAFRCANDTNAMADPSDYDLDATYEVPGEQVYSALDSPVFSPGGAGVRNLYLGWNEYYETEAKWDPCTVLATEDGGVNWNVVRIGVSGITTGWVHRVADLSDYSGATNLQVRFLFRTQNSINNAYRGWYVDDVRAYGVTAIAGTVRNIDGAPVNGATVYAIGRGGITNRIQGHKYVLPGKILGKAFTDTHGDYRIDGLYQGEYYLKVTHESYRSEFWNGMLYNTSNAYFQSFGEELNPGVSDRALAETTGLVDLSATNSMADCYFEIEPGSSRGKIAVLTDSGNYPVYLNQLNTNAVIWNGSTNSPAFVSYLTTNNSSLAFPDWETNSIVPTLLEDVDEGDHVVYLHPGWSDIPLIPQIQVPVRSAERTLVMAGTNQSSGRIYIETYDGPYNFMIDGRTNSGYVVDEDTPTNVTVLAGDHEVGLLAGGYWIAPKNVTVPAGGRAFATFTSNDVSSIEGWISIRTRDLRGDALTGAEVYLNGMPLASNQTVEGRNTTPLTIKNLRSGTHWIYVRKDGYRTSGKRLAAAYSSQTNTITVTLREADRDYDIVGDAFEEKAYTNLFLFSRNDDPDADGLVNKVEYDHFRLYGLDLNIFDADSDDDLMSDGEEMGYDGLTNWMGRSVLQTNAIIGATKVRVYFRGRFLEGENAFNTNSIGSTNLLVSLEGDLITPTNVVWGQDAEGTPLMVFGLRSDGPADDVINTGHDFNSEAFTDTSPEDVDTEEDGMWDQFEHLFESVGLNPIETGPTEEDPDNDGLTNEREFRGVDGLANTNDWTSPATPDTDGDMIPDGWEMDHGLDPLDGTDANDDDDNDDLTNLQEWQAQTDPQNEDSDNDQLTDGLEVLTYGSNPLIMDTDGDGLTDGQEVWDSDMDPQTGLDGGFFPNWAGGNLDGDDYVDGPTDWDTDGDGMPDGFEVLDVWGNIRPAGYRLDPYDPSDGPSDYDGDGLSNLEEYLVRDALTGHQPSDFSAVMYDEYGDPVSTAGVLWDYATDPFDADSDDDGMPDGFEVERGLHPMDPIRDPDTEDPEYVRYYGTWIFGDPDADGVANINEFNIRFVLNSAADSNIVEGSTHPWFPDTDGDGLGDGEEIKAFRSNPLTQDTDEDGLMDGSGIATRKGEVHSSTNLLETNQFDRALNDFWVLWQPPSEYFPQWLQLFTNQAASSNYPAPRWGAAGALSKFLVMDDSPGNFVGKPASGVGINHQALLQNKNFMVFGGRDGVTRFDEIWECGSLVDADNWEWTLSMSNLFRDVFFSSIGQSECVAATKLYTIDTHKEGHDYIRPRPGGPAGFPLYDGDPDSGPIDIQWRTHENGGGADARANWDRTIIFGGWDTNYVYAGGFIHDWVEEYSSIYLAFSPLYYKSTDLDTNSITYGWRGSAYASIWETSNTIDEGDIYVGATASERLFTGINIGEVLNSAEEVSGAEVEATLWLKLENMGTSFYVNVYGELDDVLTTSLLNENDHKTLAARETYSDPTPYERLFVRPSAFLTTPVVSMVTTTALGGGWVSFDVSTQVVEMLNATYNDGRFGMKWEFGNNMGFVLEGMTSSVGRATYYTDDDPAELYIKITRQQWDEDNIPQVQGAVWYYSPSGTRHPHQRKSSALAYSMPLDQFILFGGVDGVRALDDTWWAPGEDWGWFMYDPVNRPPARWGHCMVSGGDGVILFGGFDKNNEPLNDLWQFNGSTWEELFPEDNEVPPPRGGACMGWSGDWIALFGGTDGDKYFNDTWVLTLPGMLHTQEVGGVQGITTTVEVARWINIQPSGEQSRGPAPRAFAAYNNNGPVEIDTGGNGWLNPEMYIFGGRAGALPTARDTDQDWVDDGLEVELGGPDAGRDPRVNALIAESSNLHVGVTEKIPYAYKRLGGIPYNWQFGFGYRSAVIDFESLKFRGSTSYPIPEEGYASEFDLPIEGHHEDAGPWYVFDAGYDAHVPEFTDLWWHRFGGADPEDPRDDWVLGEPHAEGLSENGAPPVAHSGRWCYGTKLDGYYTDSSVMQLYSPLFDLTLPSWDSTDYSNSNGFYLVFHEWLDLADPNDVVRIEAVRPSTQADIATRVPGTDPLRETITVLPNRNNAANTTGEWRRVVVPLDPLGNDTNLYLRFTLQSDASGHAGGWYIDDVGILQAGQISGLYTNDGLVYLFGADSTNWLESASPGAGGDFGFDFLPAGEYRIVTGDGSGADVGIQSGGGTWNVVINDLSIDDIVLDIAVNSPIEIIWNATVGVKYEIQYTTPDLLMSSPDPWTTLDTITATSDTVIYVDWDAAVEPVRFYRVILVGI